MIGLPTTSLSDSRYGWSTEVSRARIVDDLDELKTAADELDAPLVAAAVDAVLALTKARYWEEVFEATVRCRHELEQLERLYVHYARVDDEPWLAIGEYLEMSGEGARRKYGAGQKLEAEMQALEDLEKTEIAQLANEAKLIRLRGAREGADASETFIPPELIEQMWDIQRRYGEERRELVRKAYPDARS